MINRKTVDTRDVLHQEMVTQEYQRTRGRGGSGYDGIIAEGAA